MLSMVVGFAFQGEDNVVLIRKNRPAWQHGLLNGVGGKVEVGETPVIAMSREFLEEAGLDIPPHRWTFFCRLGGRSLDGCAWEVHFFMTYLGDHETPCSRTSEPIEIHNLGFLYASRQAMVRNLLWLLPMAKYGNLQALVYEF